MNSLLLLSILLLSALMTLAITGLLIRRAASLSLIDHPGERSAHRLPTPSGGGVAIVLVAWLFQLFLLATGHMDLLTALVLLTALPVALVGFVDDVRTVPPQWRLLLQASMAVLPVIWLGELPGINVSGWMVEPGLATWVLVPLALVWLCNLYNFMDGIDSIAAAQALFVFLLIAVLAFARAPDLSLVALGLAAAIAGFLYWNLSPARIFMGDSGSTYLGMMIGLMALLSMVAGAISFWALLLMMGVFVVDTTYTLAARLLRGENVFHAHNTHAYQHAARIYGSHGAVVLRIMLINLFWLLPLTVLSQIYPRFGVYLAISGIVPLFWMAHWLGAGKSVQDQDMAAKSGPKIGRR